MHWNMQETLQATEDKSKGTVLRAADKPPSSRTTKGAHMPVGRKCSRPALNHCLATLSGLHGYSTWRGLVHTCRSLNKQMRLRRRSFPTMMTCWPEEQSDGRECTLVRELACSMVSFVARRQVACKDKYE